MSDTGSATPDFDLRAAAGGGLLLFRQLFDADTGTFTYLLVDVPSGEGVLIDPVFEQHSRDLSLIRELGVDLVASIDTHAHADHVTGSWLMRQATGCAIGLAAAVGAENVTLPLHHGDRVAFGGRHLEVRSTPGHTDGCISVVLDDHSMACTGDALLVRGCGRCDFQQGNAHTLYRSITEQILSLPAACLLYPGHDYTGRTVTSVAEERAFNARLGGAATERDFVGHMENMKLPHPHRIAEALPGNMRSGKPRPTGAGAGQPAAGEVWAPLGRSYAGLPEVSPEWVASHRDQLTLLDVRSLEEFSGPDGRISGSLLIPLPELEARAAEIPAGAPVVVVCHSGSRSALATQQLLKAGRLRVANLHGGLARWADGGYPLEGVIAHESPSH
ncbi:MBL fold metallo-hydrolase [Cyanobium sp. FACHB-13342]|uniref:MBL fold metallo-hydrolase n=1 Tax=Cyanobium sp. FACHB-13342 TaxID=2692793 RepID=UPI0016816CDB|nr:MBL fold metallo-hydrolase [Cyanobium sp. FACHB-13342]MBD2422044.1 MBL fold metallo-hydrolase [Cyanobium sp. FACHB-13342]